MNAIILSQYDDFIKNNEVITDTNAANVVKSVGINIQRGVKIILGSRDIRSPGWV